MAEKLPAMPFYFGDWFKDEAVALCSATTRGIWVDLLGRMWVADRCGQIAGTVEQLARAARCTMDEMARAIVELADTNCARVTECSGKVTLENRRMRRDFDQRKSSTRRQKRRRGAPDADPVTDLSRECHGNVTLPISIAVSTAVENPTDSCPEPASAGPGPAATKPPDRGKPSGYLFDVVASRGKTERTWMLPLDELARFREVYGEALDVHRELIKAQQWCHANNGARKTAGGMLRFLTSWMNRAVNDRRAPPAAASANGHEKPARAISMFQAIGENPPQ